MYFNTCEYCGANLDPGEKCNCKGVRIEPAAPKKSLKTTAKQFFNARNTKDFRNWMKGQVQWTF